MSRRSQVVRTDDQGGMSSPRSLGGGYHILCATGGPGNIYGSGAVATIAAIPVESSANFRRCFVRGTVGNINAYRSDSAAGYGEWNVTFWLKFIVPAGNVWVSATYVPPADSVVSYVEYAGMDELGGNNAFVGLVESGNRLSNWADWGNGLDVFGPPLAVRSIRMEATELCGTCEITLHLSSPHGEFEQDAVIAEGTVH